MGWGITVLIVAAVLVIVALGVRRPRHVATPAPVSVSDASTYENPVDGTTIQADWHTYGDGGAVSPGLSEEPEHGAIILLSSDEVLGRNLTPEILVGFMQSVQGVLLEATKATSEPYRLLVQVTLSPKDSPSFEFFTVGVAPQDDRQRITDALEELPAIHTSREPVKLQLWHFTDRR